MWKNKEILEYSSETNQWSTRNFSSHGEFLSFLLSQEKYPGEYNLKNTELWRPFAIKFENENRYTEYSPKSREFKEFWLTERAKCKHGVIIDGFYLTRDYYFFLNFCPIFDKIKGFTTHPEVWDGHYHYSLHLEISEQQMKNSVGTKARQKGYSLFHVARILNRFWFEKDKTFKILGYDIEHIKGEWAILEKYKNHLNEHTGWYRNLNPNKIYHWEQKRKETSGIIERKETAKGNKNKLLANITKASVAKAVGGSLSLGYITEAGVNPTLDKVIEYITPNISMGSIKTGMIDVMGAVGELKDCEPLRRYCFNPEENGFRGVVDRFTKSDKLIGFFHPTIWNYQFQNPETFEVIKCYDKDGNSNIALAKECFIQAGEFAKKKGDKSYRLWKSQNPETLQDAFDTREDNPFPTHLLKERKEFLQRYKPITVTLEKIQELGKDKVIHKISNREPITTLDVKPEEDNAGAVSIFEFPIENPPLGLYYAGVDPIYNLETTTSVSLFAISIYKAVHEKDGKIVQGYQVAEYIGRHRRAIDTYSVALNLILFYNALAAIESNVKDFIEWMIRQGQSSRMLRRSQLTVINEIQPNSTIREEIGVRMTAEFKKRCLEKFITTLEEPISDLINEETGEIKTIYGVNKINSLGLVNECLAYNKTGNFDRLIAYLCSLIAAESNTNRHIIKSVNPTTTKKSTVNTSHFKNNVPRYRGIKHSHFN